MHVNAYSFHLGQDSLQQTYDVMYQTYTNIFTRLGLEFRAVMADSGAIGGSSSHEFHVLAESGEDAIAFSSDSDYAANIEKAESLVPEATRPSPAADMQTVDTPDQHSIEEVSAFLKTDPAQCIKTLLVNGADEDSVVALVLRGDHVLNEIKASHLDAVASPLLATIRSVEGGGSVVGPAIAWVVWILVVTIAVLYFLTAVPGKREARAG